MNAALNSFEIGKERLSKKGKPLDEGLLCSPKIYIYIHIYLLLFYVLATSKVPTCDSAQSW